MFVSTPKLRQSPQQNLEPFPLPTEPPSCAQLPKLPSLCAWTVFLTPRATSPSTNTSTCMSGRIKNGLNRNGMQKWRASQAGDGCGRGRVDKHHKCNRGPGREWGGRGELQKAAKADCDARRYADKLSREGMKWGGHVWGACWEAQARCWRPVRHVRCAMGQCLVFAHNSVGRMPNLRMCSTQHCSPLAAPAMP